MLAQADLFGDEDENCGLTLRAAWVRVMLARHQRGVLPPDREGGARLLDAHDDYRVLRRLKPRPVDPVVSDACLRVRQRWT